MRHTERSMHSVIRNEDDVCGRARVTTDVEHGQESFESVGGG